MQLVRLFSGDIHIIPNNEVDPESRLRIPTIKDLVTCQYDQDGRNLQLIANMDSYATFVFCNRIFVVFPKILKANSQIEDWARLTAVAFLDIDSLTLVSNGAFSFSDLKNCSPFDLAFFQITKCLKLSMAKLLNRKFVLVEDEVAGIKGKIHFAKTVRKFFGLQHKTISEFDELQDYGLLFGIIKNFLSRLQSVAISQAVSAEISSLMATLESWKEEEFTRQNLVRCKRDLSSVRFNKIDINNIISILDAFMSKTSHQSEHFSGFSLNMEYLFEELVRKTLCKMNLFSNVQVLSGNKKSGILHFQAGGMSRGKTYIHDLTIKPDVYFKKHDKILSIIDAKYKVDLNSKDDQIRGIVSGDLYQMISYSLFASQLNKGIVPQLFIVYPGWKMTELMESIGSIEMQFPDLNAKVESSFSIKVNVLQLDVTKALGYINGTGFTGVMDAKVFAS